MKKYLIGLVLAIAVLGCPPVPDPHHPGPTPDAKDTDQCDAAEKKLEELECKDRRGDPMWVNKKGERFGDTCRIAQKKGTIFLNPKCVADAKTCEEANSCPPTSE